MAVPKPPVKKAAAKKMAPKPVVKPTPQAVPAKPVSPPVAAAPKAVEPLKKALPPGFALVGVSEIPKAFRQGVERGSSYPLADMAPDTERNAFKVALTAEGDEARAKERRVVSNRLSGVVRRFKLKNPSANFAVRALEDGVLVVRTA